MHNKRLCVSVPRGASGQRCAEIHSCIGFSWTCSFSGDSSRMNLSFRSGFEMSEYEKYGFCFSDHINCIAEVRKLAFLNGKEHEQINIKVSVLILPRRLVWPWPEGMWRFCRHEFPDGWINQLFDFVNAAWVETFFAIKPKSRTIVQRPLHSSSLLTKIKTDC